jgi:hypothetical protein
MGRPKRRNRSSDTGPEALVARLPDELRRFWGFTDDDFRSHATAVAAWLMLTVANSTRPESDPFLILSAATFLTTKFIQHGPHIGPGWEKCSCTSTNGGGVLGEPVCRRTEHTGSNPFGRATPSGARSSAVSTAHLEPRSRFRGEVDGIGLGEISRSSHRGPLAIFGEEEFVLAYRAFDGVHAER